MQDRKPLPPIEVVRSLLEYRPETGEFFWRERPEDMFPARRHALMWNKRFAGKPAFNIRHHAGYLYGGLFGSNFSTHRVAWYYQTGEIPDEVDHVNGDRKDNRFANLRDVTRKENCKNAARRTRSRSGVTGLSWDAVNFRWHVRVGKKHIGRFKDFDEAVAARKAAASEQDFHPNHGRKPSFKGS